MAMLMMCDGDFINDYEDDIENKDKNDDVHLSCIFCFATKKK